MTSKTNVSSKTVWGFGVFLLVGGLQAVGWLPDASWVAELVQWAGGLFGVGGLRDALR